MDTRHFLQLLVIEYIWQSVEMLYSIQVPPKSFSNNISYCKFLNIFGAFLHDSCMFPVD